jgi:hypothetical protein
MVGAGLRVLYSLGFLPDELNIMIKYIKINVSKPIVD